MFKPNDTKCALKIVAIAAAIAALAAGVAVLITKLCKKKTTKKYYIECDCDDNSNEIEQENNTDGEIEAE